MFLFPGDLLSPQPGSVSLAVTRCPFTRACKHVFIQRDAYGLTTMQIVLLWSPQPGSQAHKKSRNMRLMLSLSQKQSLLASPASSFRRVALPGRLASGLKQCSSSDSGGWTPFLRGGAALALALWCCISRAAWTAVIASSSPVFSDLFWPHFIHK